MNKAINIIAWIFLILGVLFSLTVLYTAFNDDKISLNLLDWKYIEKISYSFSLLAMLFGGAGTFAIFLTLIKQQEQFNKAQRQIETQQFESTFFNMLNQVFNIKNNINGNVNGKKYEGQEFLHEILNCLKKEYNKNISLNQDVNRVLNEISDCNLPVSSKIKMVKEDLNLVYMNIYNLNHTQLGHFFRYLYNMMKFVILNRENESFSDASKYIQIIQAQLSNDELGMIFCNTISDKAYGSNGENLLFNWIENYSFLENIDKESLLHKSLHVLYPRNKFKFLNSDERKMRNNITN